MKKTEVQFRKTSVVPLGPQKKHQEREKRQQAEDLVRTLSLPGKHEPEIPLQINTEEKEETRRVASNERGSVRRRILCVLLCGVVAAGCIGFLPQIKAVMPQAALISAGLLMPEGGEQLFQNHGVIPSSSSSAQDESTLPAGVNSTESMISSESGSQVSSADASSQAPSSVESILSSASGENILPVKETSIVNTGNYKSKDSLVQVINKSQVHKFDVDEELAKQPDVKLIDTEEPQVLIYHTHTTEAYRESFTGTYEKGEETHSQNPRESVVNVGNIITEKLNEAGIVTIHDTTINDSPAYNGAYTRSLNKAEEYLKQHPSIQVILDVHRDSLTQEDGTKLKPTATINGKKAAQIMIVSGCDDYGQLGYPDWEYNLRFGLRLQRTLATDYTGLMRPLYFWNIRYNQHLTHGTLLVEFGTEANTYEEVAYSAELFAEGLIKQLSELKE